MAKPYQIFGQETIASIRDVQRNPSRALQGITRVVRGSKTIGFFFSNDEFDEVLEDLEALASKELQARVRAARKQLKTGVGLSLDVVAARYGV